VRVTVLTTCHRLLQARYEHDNDCKRQKTTKPVQHQHNNYYCHPRSPHESDDKNRMTTGQQLQIPPTTTHWMMMVTKRLLFESSISASTASIFLFSSRQLLRTRPRRQQLIVSVCPRVRSTSSFNYMCEVKELRRFLLTPILSRFVFLVSSDSFAIETTRSGGMGDWGGDGGRSRTWGNWMRHQNLLRVKRFISCLLTKSILFSSTALSYLPLVHGSYPIFLLVHSSSHLPFSPFPRSSPTRTKRLLKDDRYKRR
jgi:hypothetical protein